MTAATQAVPAAASAFHAGERAAQERVLGAALAQGRMAAVGRAMIRSAMPEQHRDFFAQRPFVVVGSADADGQPWASVLAAPPGFLQSPDPQALVVQALPDPADPLHRHLQPGARLGLLGIEPHTRRRNRMNGVVEQRGATGFSVRVQQSFGNCPQYIQARQADYVAAAAPGAWRHSTQLDDAARALIGQADTFFIATASAADAGLPLPAGEDEASRGVDVSHRGGKPGFVRVDADGTLTVPDFTGNHFFNTIGNIVAHPRAGLLFIDFASGDAVYVAATVQIVWDGPEVEAFAGAQRLLRFQPHQVIHASAAVPLRWGASQQAPQLAGTGSWH